jgi:hypothetical protein
MQPTFPVFRMENTGTVMDNHDNTSAPKGFSWHSQTWYGPTQPIESGAVDMLNIGFYPIEGGTTGEFMIQWFESGFYNRNVPRLMAHSDGWQTLADMTELIQLLATIGKDFPAPQEVVDGLLALGFRDTTQREGPVTEPFASIHNRDQSS